MKAYDPSAKYFDKVERKGNICGFLKHTFNYIMKVINRVLLDFAQREI